MNKPERKAPPAPARKTPPPRKAPPAPAKKVNNRSGSNTSHAKLSPSYASTWLNCAAALAMGVNEADTSSEASIRGTALHAIGENCINNYLKYPEQKGGKTPDHYIDCYPLACAANAGSKEAAYQFTKEDARALEVYVKRGHELADIPDAVLTVEKRIELTAVLDLVDIPYSYVDRDGIVHEGKGIPTFGTGDLVALIPSKRGPVTVDHATGEILSWRLVVGDLKTGRGKVYAEGVPGSRGGNKQLMIYALGCYFEYLSAGYKIDAIDLEIYAPYMGYPDGMDRFEAHPVSMRTFQPVAQKAAKAAIAALSKGKAKLTSEDFNPGDAQCQWCKARDICGAKSRAVMADMGFDDPAPKKAPPPPRKAGSLPPPPRKKTTEVNADEIAANYAKIPALKAFIASAEKAMNQLMLGGEGHPAWKLVEVSGGNRSYSDEAQVIKILEAGKYNVDKYKVPGKLIAPGKLLEELGGDDPVTAKQISKYIVTPEKKAGIAPADDPRPAYTGAKKKDLDFD